MGWSTAGGPNTPILWHSEVRNDDSGVADGICGKRGRVLLSDCRTQALRCVAKGDRERMILLNAPKMMLYTHVLNRGRVGMRSGMDVI